MEELNNVGQTYSLRPETQERNENGLVEYLSFRIEPTKKSD